MGSTDHKLSCLIVDDEPLAVDILKDYVEKIPYLQLSGSLENGMEALRYLKEHKTDLVFLDIQMPNLTGIQLIEVLSDPPMIIFTTAYENYALKSYEYDAIDYLLKPIEFERFVKAVEKAYDRKKGSSDKNSLKTELSENTSERATPEFLFVKTEYRMQRVQIRDILYIEGMKNYLRIATRDEKIMTLSNFKTIEAALPENNFQRIHKSYIVAIDKIESIERNRVNIGGHLFPVSDTYKEDFYKKIDHLSIG